MKDFRSFEISDPQFEPDNLRFITIKSENLKGRGDCTVFLPSGELEPGIPLVILLHGVYGSHWAWTYKINVHKIALKLMQEKKIAPMAIAMPSDGLWGDGSGYLDHNNKNFEKWIIDDVPAMVRKGIPQVNENSQLFIGGLSMGGFGAMRLAAKYAKHFLGVSAHSSITNMEDFSTFLTEKEIEYYKNNFGKEEISEYILANKDNVPSIRFDCGENDPLVESNRKLHNTLLEHGITHQYEEYKGGHSNEYWSANIHRSLIFFNRIKELVVKK